MEAAQEYSDRADRALAQGQREKEEIGDKVTEQTKVTHEARVRGPILHLPDENIINTSQYGQRGIRDYITNATARLQAAEAKVKAEELRLIEVSNGGYARKQEEYEAAKSRAAAAQTEYESHQQGQASLRHAVESAESKESEAKKQWDLKKNDLNQANSRLRELTKENAQIKYGFPNKLQTLLNAIQQERSFAAPPIGPVGHHVTLLQPKWASVIENTIGKSLSAFVVKTHGDQKILSGIMKRVGW